MRTFALIFLCIIVSACSNGSVNKRLLLADNIASSNMMEGSLVKTDGFSIMTYQKILSDNTPMNVYIEGDGFAWVSPKRLSSNPTPRNPIALRLASLDNSPNVVYLARPCQYVNLKTSKLCEAKFWHGSKYSKSVVDSLGQAIDRIKAKEKVKDVNLVGFSGGGGIVAILAATRSDVLSFRSVAGNLNHVAFNRYHKVDQLNDSLNAADFVNKLSNIPQMYISGEGDKVVPPFIARDFAENVYSTAGCVNIVDLPEVTHHKGWEKHWHELITKPLKCQYKNEG